MGPTTPTVKRFLNLMQPEAIRVLSSDSHCVKEMARHRRLVDWERVKMSKRDTSSVLVTSLFYQPQPLIAHCIYMAVLLFFICWKCQLILLETRTFLYVLLFQYLGKWPFEVRLPVFMDLSGATGHAGKRNLGAIIPESTFLKLCFSLMEDERKWTVATTSTASRKLWHFSCLL